MATPKGSLAIGGNRSDALQVAGEQDTYTVGLVAGFNYQFLLAAATGFTNAGNLGETLIGPDNVAITGGSGTTSIHLTPTTSGTYTLSIAAPSGSGNYTLTATPQDDYGTVPGQLTVGNSTTGVIDSAGDADTFTIGLVAGFNYQFLLAAATGFINAGNLGETLIGPNNVAITGGSGTTSIHLAPTTSGTYTLSVAAPSGLGSYSLTATPQDDYGTIPGQLAVGGHTTGVLESAGDTDTFTIPLIAGYNYQFLVAAAAGFTNAGNLGETLIGPNNVAITGGSGTTSIHLTPTTSGTYTLSVAAPSGLGAYT